MKNLLITISLFFVSHILSAQVIGKQFPEMQVETVEDVVVQIPDAGLGKYTLIGIAYSKKSEEDLNTWFQPVFNKFIAKSTGLFSSFAYDVNVFFIPMFTGVNAAATGTAKKKAIKNIDSQLLPHVLFYKGEIKTYKEALDFEKKDVPYFFVLDNEGMIVYATTGRYSDEKMAKVEEVLD
jgi:hypothetical protein